MQKVIVVVDLQFGSTGKGQIAGSIGRKWGADTAVCANGPNAGHTYRWRDEHDDSYDDEKILDHSIMHTVMPVCAVLPTVRNILIGPGAVVDPIRLIKEITENADLLKGKRLIIHPNATIVYEHHKQAEAGLVLIGSTMKGTAEATIEKLRRGPAAPIAKHYIWNFKFSKSGLDIVVDADEYDRAIDSSEKLMVEGAQGASLSIHSSFYPHTTSRDVSVNQIWADCRLPRATRHHSVWTIGVARTYPIRVANRKDADGNQIGYSGGCYPDQKEIEWSEIGREAELTTVTRLPRRLFTFSTQQILDAARYNAPTCIALTFCDYLPSYNDHHSQHIDEPSWPTDTDSTLAPDLRMLINRIEAAAGCPVQYVSFGPCDTDIQNVDKWTAPGRPVLSKFRPPHGV